MRLCGPFSDILLLKTSVFKSLALPHSEVSDFISHDALREL